MARMTLEASKRRVSTIDWDRVNATTDADIDRHAKEDGTDVDLPGLAYPSPATVRRHLSMKQKDIARLAGVSTRTWQNWEQGRVSLDPAIRTLLRILYKEPDAVRRAMAA